MQLKALTIQQPWAWAIAAGLKRVENRNIRTHYRGQIAIHAGKSFKWLDDGEEFISSLGYSLPCIYRYGAVVAIAELVDCAPCTQPGRYASKDCQDLIDDPFAFGPWCYVLTNIRPLHTPVPWKGQQGWFTVEIPDNLITAK